MISWSRHLYLIGEYERSVLDVLYELSQPGDVLLDIGANLGYVSACFLRLSARGSKVSVDPQSGRLVHQYPADHLVQLLSLSDTSLVAPASERKGDRAVLVRRRRSVSLVIPGSFLTVPMV